MSSSVDKKIAQLYFSRNPETFSYEETELVRAYMNRLSQRNRKPSYTEILNNLNKRWNIELDYSYEYEYDGTWSCYAYCYTFDRSFESWGCDKTKKLAREHAAFFMNEEIEDYGCYLDTEFDDRHHVIENSDSDSDSEDNREYITDSDSSTDSDSDSDIKDNREYITDSDSSTDDEDSCTEHWTSVEDTKNITPENAAAVKVLSELNYSDNLAGTRFCLYKGKIVDYQTSEQYGRHYGCIGSYEFVVDGDKCNNLKSLLHNIKYNWYLSPICLEKEQVNNQVFTKIYLLVDPKLYHEFAMAVCDGTIVGIGEKYDIDQFIDYNFTTNAICSTTYGLVEKIVTEVPEIHN